MRLANLSIKNYRSVKDSGEIQINPFQALVGENNAGKSNILNALEAFLTAGSGGAKEEDFNNPADPICITATFAELSNQEKKPPLRKYLLGDKLILEKRIALQPDRKDPGKKKPEAEYHGYIASPKDWWLSIEGIQRERGEKPKWKDIAEEKQLTQYVTDSRGGFNKASFEKGLAAYLEDHPDVEYEEPTLGSTQALGLQPALLNALPSFYILPAITDYSDEIDKRSTSTSFRKLMADLSDRLLVTDERYQEINNTLRKLHRLLNAPKADEVRVAEDARLSVLSAVETRIKEIVARSMPSIESIRLSVTIDEIKDVFSQGIEIWVNDGVETDVLRKGHGLQRCIVFGLIQALVLNQRNQLVSPDNNVIDQDLPRIILAIEEPELYIHPQMKRFIYRVLEDFALFDQVIYATHDPVFVEVSKYDHIAVVRKDSLVRGTKVIQCSEGVLGNAEDKRGFKFFNSFDIVSNELFFARKVILVEGEQDKIGIVAIGRHLGLFKEFPEELGYSIIVTESKEEMPKFMKLLNTFQIPYVVLRELDGNPEADQNRLIQSLLSGNECVDVPKRVEDAAGHQGHFGNSYFAKKFFGNPENVQEEFKQIVRDLCAHPVN